MKMKSGRRVIIIAAGIAWLFAVGGGLRIVWRYENAPGTAGSPPAEWPADSRVERQPELATLVMLVHPHCPCSRASVGELALLMTSCRGLVNAHVVFVKPEGFPDRWEETDLWRSAASIPGVSVLLDDGGIEARRFGSETSGQTALYGADGRLLFSGGITGSRGHSGDNAGRSSIVALLTASPAAQRETPVFGCPLFDASSETVKKESCHAGHGD
jgi:hypothetical protein